MRTTKHRNRRIPQSRAAWRREATARELMAEARRYIPVRRFIA